MLSQDDRRALELIANHISSEDPEFAAGLGAGKPRRPADDRRWPLIMMATLATTVFVVGLLLQSIVVVLIGALAGGGVGIAYRLHLRRGQRPPRRRRDGHEGGG